MNYLDRIQIDASVCGCRPVIRGTRVPAVIVVAQVSMHSRVERIEKPFSNLRSEPDKFVGWLGALSKAPS